MTDLRKALADHLEIRRTLGFKLHWADKCLGDFLDFLEVANNPFITSALALAWATQPQLAKPDHWAKRLRFVRGFARYVHTLDSRTEVPPPDLLVLPRVVRKQPPNLYADEEVSALMEAANGIKQPFRACTYLTLIGLLATTGMRVGEAIALDRDDVDWESAVLTIRRTKFGKSREVPVHTTTLEALARYHGERNRNFTVHAVPAFFVSLRNRRLIYQNVRATFLRLVEQADLANKPRRPRLHDLRHSFACTTLKSWYEAGVDVEQKLPLLSTYLGHVSPSTTYWYLTAVPELLCSTANRLEVHLGDIS